MQEVDWDDDAAEKQGYETFMLKEIWEQPDAIAETIGERLYHGTLQLDGLNLSEAQIRGLSRVVFLACGTLPRRPGRPVPARGVGADPVGVRHRERMALPPCGDRRTRS